MRKESGEVTGCIYEASTVCKARSQVLGDLPQTSRTSPFLVAGRQLLVGHWVCVTRPPKEEGDPMQEWRGDAGRTLAGAGTVRGKGLE